ncbi:transporter substrate-binding domain-containing protein [Gloeocapsa sp. PCC 73106]|uniref:transporter substrate-binding domain-containing protein n=1 Tax=Gloeocapsa sp. PCC 73106 TaxID=102232 RepID=UPI0002ABF17B|nr:transporter substrate-binding domain-containing protein [Gloeocapsa sp. PCC 73106]ELR98405.1 periplasmic component of amino acid ABC-type transporter/signal transduction system [Gloeocapsa sp. PCC 73106]
MKRIIQLMLLSWGVSVGLVWANTSAAQPVETEIKETGIVKVGIRNDSPLFGYGEASEGYCRDFGEALAITLTETLGTAVTAEFVPSTTQNRWDLVSAGEVHLECGPNTITQDRETEKGIKFSRPFFFTATQIFVKVDVTEEDVKTGTIGTISGTTNASEMQMVYPESQIQDTFTTRIEGIEAVQAGEITGFASDGILIIGSATVLQLDQNSFALATPIVNGRQFCAAYGMILPGSDENAVWRETINNLIANSGKGAEIWGVWFDPVSPYIDKTLADCQR